MAQLEHFYHLWLGGAWQVRAAEHFQALREAGFPGRVHVGLVGSEQDRLAARRLLDQQAVPAEVEAEAETGFEEVTLRLLRRLVVDWPGDTAVLYMHAKGTFNPTIANLLWAGSMTAYLVGNWHERVAELNDHDLAVETWLDRKTKDPEGRPVGACIAAGNFWWARADYLATLPLLPQLLASRYEAEGWVGQDFPAVAFKSVAWPTFQEVFWREDGVMLKQWVPVY